MLPTYIKKKQSVSRKPPGETDLYKNQNQTLGSLCSTYTCHTVHVFPIWENITFFMISCSLAFCMSTINSGLETILESISGVIPANQGGAVEQWRTKAFQLVVASLPLQRGWCSTRKLSLIEGAGLSLLLSRVVSETHTEQTAGRTLLCAVRQCSVHRASTLHCAVAT